MFTERTGNSDAQNSTKHVHVPSFGTNMYNSRRLTFVGLKMVLNAKFALHSLAFQLKEFSSIFERAIHGYTMEYMYLYMCGPNILDTNFATLEMINVAL